MKNNGKVLISVIVAAYNIADYLPRCVDSLLCQTYPNIEIILVDDGSADETGKVCDFYAGLHNEIRVIHRENGGLSAARNSGLKEAKGDFIGFVDGDDWVEPDMYGRMLQAALEHQAQIVTCSYLQIGENGEEVHPTGNIIPLTGEEALDWYINGHSPYRIYNSVWSKLFARELIKDIDFPEGHKSEDIMYTTRALLQAEKCVLIDETFYNYVMDREDSIMNSSLEERRFQDEIPFWREQIAYLQAHGRERLSRQAAYQFYRRMLKYFIDFKKRKMEGAAARLATMLKMERKEIRKIYREEYVKTGDRARMKLALLTPGGYYLAVRAYDKIIIPLRQ